MPQLRAADSGCVVLGLVLVLQMGSAVTPGRGPGVGPPTARFDGGTFDPLVERGIREGAYPGAALVVGRRDTTLFAKGYGHLTWSPGSPPVDPESTLYDLASLTKVLATTTSLMVLVDRGKVRLDAPVAAYVREFRGPGRDGVTVWHLLTHTSGLRPTLPLYRDAADSAAALRLVYAASPEVAPGTRVTYSDLNAILLGEIVRRAAGEPLDVFAEREVLGPLELRQTMFRPAARLRPRIAPTGVWRGHPVAGVVNDRNAARLGGVAGHAGLFATARDVAQFAQFILREGTLRDGRRLVHDARDPAGTGNPTRGPSAWVAGRPHRGGGEQRGRAVWAPELRPYGLDRDVAVDRPRPGVVRGVADQPGVRAAHARLVHAAQGSARARRRRGCARVRCALTVRR